MLIWRLAATLFLFRWIFRDPAVDVRYLAAGAVIPDVVDLGIGTVAVPDIGSGELWAHTLVVPTLVTVGVLVATRRGQRRKAWMALAVGWLFHLLIDGMWATREVFWWPAFGWDLPTEGPGFWTSAWEAATTDPVRWALEVAGLGYLVLLGRRLGLSDPERRRDLVRTGRLPDPGATG